MRSQDVAETDFVEYKEDLDSILTVIVPRMQTLSVDSSVSGSYLRLIDFCITQL